MGVLGLSYYSGMGESSCEIMFKFFQQNGKYQTNKQMQHILKAIITQFLITYGVATLGTIGDGDPEGWVSLILNPPKLGGDPCGLYSNCERRIEI